MDAQPQRASVDEGQVLGSNVSDLEPTSAGGFRLAPAIQQFGEPDLDEFDFSLLPAQLDEIEFTAPSGQTIQATDLFAGQDAPTPQDIRASGLGLSDTAAEEALNIPLSDAPLTESLFTPGAESVAVAPPLAEAPVEMPNVALDAPPVDIPAPMEIAAVPAPMDIAPAPMEIAPSPALSDFGGGDFGDIGGPGRQRPGWLRRRLRWLRLMSG